RVAAAFDDEGGPVPGDAVELGAVRLPPLSQLFGAVAHALLPLARLQAPAMITEAVENVIDPPGAAEVGGKPRQPVVDDVSVRVIEPGQHGGSFELDDLRSRPAQLHHLGPAAREDLAASDREMAVGVQTGPAPRPPPPTRQDQYREHSADRLIGCPGSTAVPTRSPCHA